MTCPTVFVSLMYYSVFRIRGETKTVNNRNIDPSQRNRTIRPEEYSVRRVTRSKGTGDISDREVDEVTDD